MKQEITNKNKVFFKNPRITKSEIVNYYQKIAPHMLPHVKNRPVNMVRAPDGMLGHIFFQQNMPAYFPSWIDFFKTFRISKGGFARHVLINKPDTLIYLANEGVVTIHIWNSRVKNIKNPDRIVFDLDPPEGKNGFESVREVAFLLKKELEKTGIKPYLMTTGSKGVHLVLPIKADTGFKKAKAFTKAIVNKMEAEYPQKVTGNFRKYQRTGKVFIDYLRNNYGQTAVAPYSVRLKSGAPIACPIFWADLGKYDFGPQTINIKNVFQYLRKGDPWKGIYKSPRSVVYYEKKLKMNK
ncbi:MAG: non-homologous end-joining DNA ligase [Patescibacteria group bacterium]|nr:non-homologous end-joining DNA ligase [Patescibacteria group bacterium]